MFDWEDGELQREVWNYWQVKLKYQYLNTKKSRLDVGGIFFVIKRVYWGRLCLFCCMLFLSSHRRFLFAWLMWLSYKFVNLTFFNNWLFVVGSVSLTFIVILCYILVFQYIAPPYTQKKNANFSHKNVIIFWYCVFFTHFCTIINRNITRQKSIKKISTKTYSQIWSSYMLLMATLRNFKNNTQQINL